MSRISPILVVLMIGSLILTAGAHTAHAAPPSAPAAAHQAADVPLTPVARTAVSPWDPGIVTAADALPFNLSIFPTTTAVDVTFQTLIATPTGLGLPHVNDGRQPDQPRIPELSWDGFPTPTTSHQFLITDLVPGTTYAYAIYITSTQTPVLTGTFTTLGEQ